MSTQYLTSESVRAGHPDKLCDIIADTVLDKCLSVDPHSRVACEVMATKGRIIVAGEITCVKYIKVEPIVQHVLRMHGYSPDEFKIEALIHRQSKDIAAGVSEAIEARTGKALPGDPYAFTGAGDQGTVYGYATDETEQYLALPYILATNIVKRLDALGNGRFIEGLRPDGKAQVTVLYEDNKPIKVVSVVVSAQHDDDVNRQQFRSDILDAILPCFEGFIAIPDEGCILVNPAGDFVEGGPAADTGLTGRKLMVDTYGGLARHGGGAFSGKDPTKVDRSGAYMARHIAKTIVAAKLASRCEVALSYAIGKAYPVAVNLITFDTGCASGEMLRDAVLHIFDLRPAAIIDYLNLRQVEYARTAAYGHFTNPDYLWERMSEQKVAELRRHIPS